MKIQHTLVSGESVEFTLPTREIAAFFKRVVAAASEASVTEMELIDLVFGPSNPLLNRTVVPGKVIPTLEVYQNPIFQVMIDCIIRKRMPGSTGSASMRNKYTVSVPEAARQLGISESAVRQAIYANRLRALKEGGTYYLTPQSIQAYRVSRRGPRPRNEAFQGPCGASLDVKLGTSGSTGLYLRHAQAEFSIDEGHEGEWNGSIPEGWYRLGILAVSGEGAKFWQIEPAEGDSQISFEGFHIRGGFSIIEAVNIPPKAKASFKGFVAK